MTPEQKAIQERRLFLEEQTWTSQKYLGEVKRECKEHVVIRGRILWSPRYQKVVNTQEGNCGDGGNASCAVCGEDLGWYCPKNPKGYCEYDRHGTDDCIFCGIPEERK